MLDEELDLQVSNLIPLSELFQGFPVFYIHVFRLS